MVPPVERGFRLAVFWSIDTAGESPSMKSTSGRSSWPRNCRAYADSDSVYRRWPSAKIVSKARLDLPEPDRPVKTIIASLGSSSETSLRLCSRAPWITRRSANSVQHSKGGTLPLQAGGLCEARPATDGNNKNGPSGIPGVRSGGRRPDLVGHGRQPGYQGGVLRPPG